MIHSKDIKATDTVYIQQDIEEEVVDEYYEKEYRKNWWKPAKSTEQNITYILPMPSDTTFVEYYIKKRTLEHRSACVTYIKERLSLVQTEVDGNFICSLEGVFLTYVLNAIDWNNDLYRDLDLAITIFIMAMKSKKRGEADFLHEIISFFEILHPSKPSQFWSIETFEKFIKIN